MKKLRNIMRFAIPYWKHALLNIIFNILGVIFFLGSFTLAIPVLQILFKINKLVLTAPPLTFNMSSITENFNYFISRIIINSGETTALLYIAVALTILYFLKNLFRYLAMYYLAKVRNGAVKDIRNTLYNKITILPLAYFSDQRKGDIMARMTNDVQEVEWSIMSSLEMVFREPITIISYIITLFVISPELTGFAMVLLPLSAFLISRIGKSLRRTSDKGQAKMGSILSTIEETISGLRIIKAFNSIDFVNGRFRRLNDDYTKVMIRLYRKRDLASPLSEFLSIIVVVVVMCYGGLLILSKDSQLDAPVFLVYLLIFSQLIPPVKAFTQAFYNIQKGAASVERIEQVLKAEEIIIEKPDAKEVKSFENEIEYRDVSFSYEKESVLDHINLKIHKGKTIAVVGPSGAGKTTLVDLLPRFYNCSEGGLYIDGVNINDYRIDHLRGLMGIVNQESILFNETVFNNIAFGLDNVSEEDVERAARIANAHEFIIQMENGYNTYIGDRGVKLSGGQRQRLSIARAVLRNPPILILDEATSSLDTESERLVQDALEKLMKSRTSVVIAHRLSTIQFADEIIVIQDGKLVERGTHSELIQTNGVYRRLHDLQTFA
jgi:ATP-binding cassette, subfamily B, bacterial MsbA